MRLTALPAVVSALALASCARMAPVENPAPPHFTAAWDGHAGAEAWTGYVREALIGEAGAALLVAEPTDAADFCPRFASLDAHEREQLWVTLISAVAEKESDFDPRQRFDEPGLEEDSIGLMQLSLGDAGRYGCAFADETDIADAQKNLDCAVRIMARLIPRAGRIGGNGDTTGAAAYWSTLRDRPQNIAARRHVISKTRESAGCSAD